MRLRLLLAALILATALAAGCQTQRSVLIQADGQARLVTVHNAVTVGDALTEAGIPVGQHDRVTPDIYARLARSGSITIVRVTERTETETAPVPFPREIIRDEAMPRGETQVLQVGAAGELQRVFAITLEDGVEIDRRQTAEVVTRRPVTQVLHVGTMGGLPAVPVDGALVYLSGGNAWVMRGSSGDKRPLTFSGDLDGRVFALSANGHALAFTRRPAEGAAGLNALWALNTLVVGDAAQPQHQVDVLAASWRGEALVFTTGQPTQGPPGWKANNDLWTLPGVGRLRQSLPPTGAPGAYGWWGREIAVSPDGRMLAYGSTGEIGVLNLETGQTRLLAAFPPLRARGDWVWTPALTWSPDSLNVAAAIHGRSLGAAPPDDGPLFDLWMLPVDGAAGRILVADVGMWALPAWSPTGDYLAFGAAQEPANSAISRYDLRVLRLRDGHVFEPLRGSAWGGVDAQRPAWSPDGERLVAEHLGDLYLLDLAGGKPQALTDDGRSSLPLWR